MAYINYTYIVSTDEGNPINIEQYSEIYETVILKYHFPCCMTNNLPESEMRLIIENEFEYIKTRMPVGTHIYQIPRVIYDLFFILYKIIHTRNITKSEIIPFSSNIKHIQYSAYCKSVNMAHLAILDTTFYLNNYIIDYIRPKFTLDTASIQNYADLMDVMLESLKPENLYPMLIDLRTKCYIDNKDTIIQMLSNDDNVYKIVTSILDGKRDRNVDFIMAIDKITEDDTEESIDSLDILTKENISDLMELFINNRKLDITIRNEVRRGLDFDKIISNFKTSIYQYIDDEDARHNAITEFTQDFKDITIERCISSLNKDLLQDILRCDANDSNIYPPNTVLLYRGSADSIESPISSKSYQPNSGYSISFNTSALNGYIYDHTASTYTYLNTTKAEISRGISKIKNIYTLNKFFYGDESIEDHLFFIPPLHPYLQMISKGEFWHARSKIYNGSDMEYLSEFSSIYIDPGIVGNPSDGFPDYLTSRLDRDAIEDAYRTYMSTHKSLLPERSIRGGGRRITRKNIKRKSMKRKSMKRKSMKPKCKKYKRG